MAIVIVFYSFFSQEHQPLEMHFKAECRGRISRLPTLLSRESLLSESSTPTDSLSIPSTCYLGTQTELSDSDESLSSSSSSDEEGTDEVFRRSRSEAAEKGKLSVNSIHSCGLEFEKREKEVPKCANSEEERSSMAYHSVSEFNDSSNGAEEGQINQSPLIPPLTLRVQTERKLRESKERLERCIQTDDWLEHIMDDEVDDAVKNGSCGSSAIQNCHPFYSSTGSAEPPFQGEGGLPDNLARIADQVDHYGGAATSTSWCNDVTYEHRRNRERKVDSKSLKIFQESKNKSNEHLSQRSHNTTPKKYLGLKGGGQDPFFSNRGLGYENLESVINRNDKDAKPERVRPRDDTRNTIDKRDSNVFGIRPCFLARHTDDSGITSPIDDMGNTAENADGGSSNIFSRHQGSSCFTTEQGYQVTYSFQAPSFHSESSKVSANAQGPNPHSSFDPNPAVWGQPVPARPILSLPCNGSEHLQTLSCDDPRILVTPPHALINDDSPLALTPLLPQQRKVKDERTVPEVQGERNSDFKKMNGNPACLPNTTSIAQGLISPEMEVSALPQAAMNRNLAWETRTPVDQDTAYQGPLGVLNETSSLSNDDSLADLERRVAEACSLVEKTLKIREVKEKAMKEKERKKKEERTRKEQQARERGEREATEARGIKHNYSTEEGSSTSSGEETLEQIIIQGSSRLERKWKEREKEWMEKKGWTRKERSQDRQTKCCSCR